MRYYKVVENGYIVRIGTGLGGTEIDLDEYIAITDVLSSAPEDTDTVGYRLREDLTWEEYQIAPIEDIEISGDEAIAIILGE